MQLVQEQENEFSLTFREDVLFQKEIFVEDASIMTYSNENVKVRERSLIDHITITDKKQPKLYTVTIKGSTDSEMMLLASGTMGLLHSELFNHNPTYNIVLKKDIIEILRKEN